MITRTRAPRAVAVLSAAATLALTLFGTIIAVSPIETQAAGSIVRAGWAFAWGDNTWGQLGNGITTNSLTPVGVNLPAGTTVTAISAGLDHTLALTSTGHVLAWGYNFDGELGNGTTNSTSNSTPVAVSLPSGTTVTAIAGGGLHSLALTSTGQVLAWGYNVYGQLGNGATTNSSTPVAVSLPSGTTVTAIAGGGYHSLALTSTGQVLAWGYNDYGQLGNGTTTNRGIPVAVSLPSGTTVTAIAAGYSHSLAVTSFGQVLAWGDNESGELGNGTTLNSTTPLPVSLPLPTAVSAVACGNIHSLALTSTGQVLAWGDNGQGQLGNGTTTNSSTPVAVSLPSGTSVTAISGGYSDSLALASSGEVLAWGDNTYGELGDGTTTTSSTPVVVSAFPPAVAIAAGGSDGFAIQLPAAVLPAMANGAYGGYVTAATIQNTGTAAAAIRIDYYDQNGSPVGVGDSISNLPVNGGWTVRQDNGKSFPSSGGDAAQAGSAIVYSSQPVAAFVNEFAPGNVGDATSYSGVQVPGGVGTTLYAPTIVNNAYGGYTTGIGLLNQGSSSTNVTISYRNGSGAVVKTQTVSSLAAHAYRALYSGDAVLALPAGFAGTATITSSAGPLGAVVNETGPGGQFSSYDAVPSGSITLNVPVALNNAFGGYFTGMGIQNTTGSPGLLSVTYYDAAGTPTVKNFTIPASGSLGVYQGSATDGPPVGAYTAVIQSSTVALAAIVNEVATSTTSAMQATSYNTFGTGSSSLHLALVENAGSDPWNTGEGIMNTGTSSAAVQVTYYDTVTGAAIGTPQAQALAPHAFWGVYQPTGGLPSGTRATAVITTSSGGQVAVICNESSTTTFMSYDGQ